MNDRFKFRVWDEGMFEDSKPHYEYASVYTGLTLKMATGHHPIEQCTGLKDKNGNLIYEGDIVEDMWGDALFIKWRDSEARFAAEDDNVAYDLEDVVDGCDIIGNIHEQAEQKD